MRIYRGGTRFRNVLKIPQTDYKGYPRLKTTDLYNDTPKISITSPNVLSKLQSYKPTTYSNLHLMFSSNSKQLIILIAPSPPILPFFESSYLQIALHFFSFSDQTLRHSIHVPLSLTPTSNSQAISFHSTFKLYLELMIHTVWLMITCAQLWDNFLMSLRCTVPSSKQTVDSSVNRIPSHAWKQFNDFHFLL